IDNPWAIIPRPRWFLKTLKHYTHVFTPRRSNEAMLARAGCRAVSYLPFAYAPEAHYPEWPDLGREEKGLFESDVVFVGCADRDRLIYIRALLQAGFRVNLYGPRWKRYAQTAPIARGAADPRTMRLAIGGAKLALGLVRRANRDGNSMRTFEIPAIGGCLLAEDTEDHRVLFGAEGERVVYFKSPEDLVRSVSRLVNDEKERVRLARSVHEHIASGKHSYRDRLETILKLVPAG
ncbi:MAG: glycosyltransferase, partial [Candidatus Omnitrophica bacterium]|nr:glycosyltransferase [Candidatus Omnitrophota bacterium]